MQAVRERIFRARSIAALTGAGVSVESGIPTFRGNGGLWNEFRAEDLATPEAFERNPKLVWEWYNWRRAMVSQAQPNAGHYALTELEKRTPHFTLITQNVDDLHERAGSRNVLHLHGSLWTLRCTRCQNEMLDMRTPLPELPPQCSCGGLFRPGVVWFGEALRADIWVKAEQAARAAEVFLVLGTSAVVYPAAGLARIAKSAGATLIEVNVDPTGVSGYADFSLRGTTGEILPQLAGQSA